MEKNLAKKVVRDCVTYFKVSPEIKNKYIMGNLPEVQINQYLPFYNTGFDFAGPFNLKDRSTRGAKLIKNYVCLSVYVQRR